MVRWELCAAGGADAVRVADDMTHLSVHHIEARSLVSTVASSSSLVRRSPRGSLIASRVGRLKMPEGRARASKLEVVVA